jgi:hypothetical protein
MALDNMRWTREYSPYAARKQGKSGNFLSLSQLVWWTIWKERNKRIFQGLDCSMNEIMATILQEAATWAKDWSQQADHGQIAGAIPTIGYCAARGSSYSALQAPVTGERLKAFGNGPAQSGHEFYFFSVYSGSV